MSAFEDDVEPMEEPLSRSGTPSGSRSRGGLAAGAGATGPLAAAASSSTADLLGKRAREWSPEPDEDLDTTDGKHSMWLVKVPRFLLEGWSKVDEEDRRLGTVRVYDPDHRGHQHMELLLPPHPEPAIPLPPTHPYLQTNIPRSYDLRLTSEQGSVRVRNLYAFREKLEGGDEDDDDEDLDSGTEDIKGKSTRRDERRNKGRRVVSMVGTIANEAALKPKVAPQFMSRPSASGSTSVGITPEYREVLRKRREEASKPRHTVKVLDGMDRAQVNMMASGAQSFHQSRSRNNLIHNVAAGPGSSATGTGARRGANQAPTEKFARIPRNELLDLLFELFDEYQYWSIKGLRQKVQQPEVYLREVLSSIADLHKRGPYSGNWSLKPEFSEMRKQQDRQETLTAAAAQAVADSQQQEQK